MSKFSKNRRFLTFFNKKSKKFLKFLHKKIEYGCNFFVFAHIIIGKMEFFFKNAIDINGKLGYNLGNKNKKNDKREVFIMRIKTNAVPELELTQKNGLLVKGNGDKDSRIGDEKFNLRTAAY